MIAPRICRIPVALRGPLSHAAPASLTADHVHGAMGPLHQSDRTGAGPRGSTLAVVLVSLSRSPIGPLLPEAPRSPLRQHSYGGTGRVSLPARNTSLASLAAAGRIVRERPDDGRLPGQSPDERRAPKLLDRVRIAAHTFRLGAAACSDARPRCPAYRRTLLPRSAYPDTLRGASTR